MKLPMPMSASQIAGFIGGTVEGDGNADHRQHGEQDPQPRPRGVRVDGDLDDCQQDAEEDDGGYELAEVAVALALVLGAQPRAPGS